MPRSPLSRADRRPHRQHRDRRRHAFAPCPPPLVTERSLVAMPEVGIGFVPDVGGTYLLARAPGELGTHAALTASRKGHHDAILLRPARIAHRKRPARLRARGTAELPSQARRFGTGSAHCSRRLRPGFSQGAGRDRRLLSGIERGSDPRLLDERPKSEARAAAAGFRALPDGGEEVTLQGTARGAAPRFPSRVSDPGCRD